MCGWCREPACLFSATYVFVDALLLLLLGEVKFGMHAPLAWMMFRGSTSGRPVGDDQVRSGRTSVLCKHIHTHTYGWWTVAVSCLRAPEAVELLLMCSPAVRLCELSLSELARLDY